MIIGSENRTNKMRTSYEKTELENISKKTESISINEEAVEIKEPSSIELNRESLVKKSVAELKELCKEKGLKVVGTKKDLVERLSHEQKFLKNDLEI